MIILGYVFNLRYRDYRTSSKFFSTHYRFGKLAKIGSVSVATPRSYREIAFKWKLYRKAGGFYDSIQFRKDSWYFNKACS